MGISETSWTVLVTGASVQVDGCHRYGNESEGRKGGGGMSRPQVAPVDNAKGNDGVFGTKICRKAN